LQQHGAAKRVEVFQAWRGFDGVDAKDLDNLIANAKPPVSDKVRAAALSDKAFTATDAKALALVMHYLPQLQKEDLCICKRYPYPW
jgi:hypothetical protein